MRLFMEACNDIGSQKNEFIDTLFNWKKCTLMFRVDCRKFFHPCVLLLPWSMMWYDRVPIVRACMLLV